MNSNANENSEVVLALKERLANRPHKVVDCQEFISAGGRSFGQVSIRVATKSEENAALLQAERFIREMTADSKSELKDPDIVDDVKTVHILHAVVRDAKDPKNFPAFPSPKWMMQHLTRDEIGALLNISASYQAEVSPLRVTIDDESVELLADGLAQFASNPEATRIAFGDKTRAWLEEAMVLLAVKYDAAKTTIGAQVERMRDYEGRHQEIVGSAEDGTEGV